MASREDGGSCETGPLDRDPPPDVRRPHINAGTAAWRSLPVAIVMGVLLVAVEACGHANAPGPKWDLRYSDEGDHAGMAALELEAAPVPVPSAARLVHLECGPQLPGRPGRAPSRAPEATRDRSPPRG